MFSRKSEKLPPFHVMEVIERAHELEGAGRSIIHLEIGELDFPTAWASLNYAKLLLSIIIAGSVLTIVTVRSL